MPRSGWAGTDGRRASFGRHVPGGQGPIARPPYSMSRRPRSRRSADCRLVLQEPWRPNGKGIVRIWSKANSKAAARPLWPAASAPFSGADRGLGRRLRTPDFSYPHRLKNGAPCRSCPSSLVAAHRLTTRVGGLPHGRHAAGSEVSTTPNIYDTHIEHADYDPLDRDPVDVMRMLTLHREAGGTLYTGLENGSAAKSRLDASLGSGAGRPFWSHPPSCYRAGRSTANSSSRRHRSRFVRLLFPVR